MSPARVVVADDDADIRDLVAFKLEAAGMDVVAVADGAAALEACQDVPPDLVILDVMMPRMSGIEVLTEIRQDPELEHLPVLMLTAAGDDDTTWAGWQAGASTYIDKPFDHATLLGWIEHLLADQRGGDIPGQRVYELAEAV